MGPVYLGEQVHVGGVDTDSAQWVKQDGYHGGATDMFIHGAEGHIGMHAVLNWEEVDK